ncbi:MAG TPA: arylformamidase [Thermoanaerobaculia bacterium]|nr:arylformamidase [Thermoanaerobaculia bacterium]
MRSDSPPVRLFDISPPVAPGIAVWPGDTPYRAELSWAISRGDSVNVSALTSTPHLGAHADAPFHVDERGASVSELPLEPFLGPCRVVEVPPAPLVLPAHLAGIDLADPPRLLLKTGSVGDRSRFPASFSALSPELARALGEAGALLVGIDSPSVDPFDSKDLAAHHALVAGGVANLEGLYLDEVPPGLYELVALPLRLVGLDASPVRAVLRALPG